MPNLEEKYESSKTVLFLEPNNWSESERLTKTLIAPASACRSCRNFMWALRHACFCCTQIFGSIGRRMQDILALEHVERPIGAWSKVARSQCPRSSKRQKGVPSQARHLVLWSAQVRHVVRRVSQVRHLVRRVSKVRHFW